MGVSWPAFRPHDYADPERHVERIVAAGFELVTLVPTYTYVGLNRISHEFAPSFSDLESAIAVALSRGLEVVVKPHLDPLLYAPGFEPLATENPSWRTHCPWRGYFDVDPESDAYLAGVLLPTLEAIAGAQSIQRRTSASVRPVRLDLGSELMNSTVYFPDRWARVARRMRRELEARGLEGKVLLSHNFSHHVQIPEDFVDRMDRNAREALSTYVRSLDAIAISQYMDLTVAMPAEERGRRLPTSSEVASALARHEADFLRDILVERLGLVEGELPPLHIGEFGIGIGGLAHPNLWAGELDEEGRRELRRAVIVGHEGLLAFVGRAGIRARSAVLWVTGGTYDVFGWMDPSSRIEEVVDAYARFFAESAGDPRRP